MKQILSIAFFLLMAGYCIGQDTIPDYIPGEIHVKSKTEYPFAICKYDTATWPYFYSSIPGFDTVAQAAGVFRIEQTFKILGPTSDRLRNIYSIYFEADTLTEGLLTFLENSNQVEYATKVAKFRLTNTPVDPMFNTTDQWNLAKIHALDAWGLETGKADVRIAIVDDAVLLNHEELKNKIWVNQGETALYGRWFQEVCRYWDRCP